MVVKYVVFPLFIFTGCKCWQSLIFRQCIGYSSHSRGWKLFVVVKYVVFPLFTFGGCKCWSSLIYIVVVDSVLVTCSGCRQLLAGLEWVYVQDVHVLDSY